MHGFHAEIIRQLWSPFPYLYVALSVKLGSSGLYSRLCHLASHLVSVPSEVAFADKCPTTKVHSLPLSCMWRTSGQEAGRREGGHWSSQIWREGRQLKVKPRQRGLG